MVVTTYVMEDQNGSEKCLKLRWQWTRITCSLGFICLIVAIISRLTMPIYVEYKIFKNLPLTKGSEVYGNWIDPPVTPTMSLYVFNITNTEAFLQGRAKPNLVELGPYVYRQTMRKSEMQFSEDEEELTHEVYREFFFEPTVSTGSEDDVVIVPNIPLFGLIKSMSKEDSYTKSTTRAILDGFSGVGPDTKPFIKVTVRELLWGYPSVLLSMQRAQENKCEYCDEGDYFGGFDDTDPFFESGFGKSSDKKKPCCDIRQGNLAPFGVFSVRNGTSVDKRTIRTGKSQPFEKGIMVEWDGKKTLDYWSGEQCNRITGRDPSGLPLLIQKSDVLSLFIGQLCRPLNFKYLKDTVVDGEFATMRFIPEENSFSSPDRVPENQCYCLTPGSCMPSGILDISGCQPGSPVYMSWPHFLHGDPKLFETVNGLSPDEDIHSFTMDLMPKYGVALSALARLQLNVRVDKNSGFGWFDNIAQDQVYLPILWLEEGINGPSDVIREKVRYLYGLPNMVANLQTLGFFVLGLALLLPEIILWSRECFRDLRQR